MTFVPDPAVVNVKPAEALFVDYVRGGDVPDRAAAAAVLAELARLRAPITGRVLYTFSTAIATYAELQFSLGTPIHAGQELQMVEA